MKVSDVRNILLKNNIREELIKINDKFLIPGAYYLYYDDESHDWIDFYYDRECFSERHFDTEDAACSHFLELIFSEPETFTDFSMKEYKNIEERGKKLIEKYVKNAD